MVALKFLNKTHPVSHFKERERSDDQFAEMDVNVDLREVYFLILHFLSAGPCKKTVKQFWDELQEHDLLPRRYHAWYSRSGECNGHGNDDGVSFPLNYDDLVNRYLHIKHDHLVKLLTQVMLTDAPPLRCMDGMSTPSATDVPTLLGTGAFSLLHRCDRNSINRPAKHVPSYLRWPHLQADHIRGLHLREIGGGFPKHHRAPSIRFACYAVAKPSTMVQKMQYVKRLRGHRAAVYCAIFDRSGRYVITGSDDRLVKIWSMETAFCLSSCRGHEGDITDLAVSSNNLLVASASNDYSIRVWRLPDGIPVSVLLGHSGAVTAIAFSPRAGFSSYLLSSSDDGTCRLWDARSSQCRPRIYLPKPRNTVTGNNSGFTSSNAPSSSSAPPLCQILCCAYNASGTVFVTGSSDTYARVWSACRSNTDDPEQPMHEIDLLAGHENDVNYVQFSGCAVASRSSASDITVEENIPKFKNSWFSRDNIVTCSRDGSAIIWTPKSSRYQGKGGRWVRAYHLKVPPPPMPPQPPRGGPRQRLLPTPRGVNMIVWSLDNRYVLAAIMDCRICVWNASDGGLVHCLTGHTASTYVLDVHPFNPRIAMSAGYDGKTILWDIWEGSPIWIYDIGRFKLVDGKFSQDGTSIVLSDDVGQIYLLSTGQGDSQKDAKYDQFFLGDYRPLNQDTHGNVVDQETQLAPHLRNIQDLLCDSSMLPYPEPYQSMYQRRRLGARGIEWRPSSLNFAVGTDGLSQEYQLFPLVDLDMVIERAPDFLDALYMMELENDAIPDETDSEYFLTDESLGEDEQECAILGSSSDSENYGSGNNLRRSKRKKSLAEVEMSTSGRRGKKRIPHERECTSFRNKRNNKSRRKNSSKRNSDKVISLRSQRLGLRSAVNGYSDDTSEISSYEEEQEGSEFDSSGSEPPLSTSITKKKKPADYLNNEKQVFADNKQSSLNDSENAIKCPEQIEPQVNGEKRKKLVLKLSMRKPTESLHLESARIQQIPSGNPHPSSSGISESEHVKDDEELRCNQKIYALVKPCTHQPNPGGYVNPVDLIHGLEGSSSHPVTRNGKEQSEFEDAYHKFSVPIGHGNHGVEAVSEDYRNKSELQNVHETETNNLCSVRSDKKSPLKLSFSLKDYKQAGNASELSSSQDSKEGFKLSTSSELAGSSYHSHESIDIRKPKPTILKFKTKIMQNSSGEEGPAFHGGDSFGNIVPRVTEGGGGSSSRSKSTVGPSSARNYNHTEYPHIATDAVRRKRSLRLKATSTETNSVSHGFPLSSSRRSEKPMEKPLDRFPNKYSETSKPAVVRFKNNKENDETRHSGDKSAVTVSNMNCPQRKPNWLLLLNQEEGYRYIPQLGDEVVYLAQGHNEYIVRSSKENAESSRSLDNLPLEIFEGRIGAVEVCLVVDLEYSFSVGSAESCCKITLKFTDTSSAMFGVEYKFALRELADFPDFIVVRTRYDVAINRIWSIREKCLVWWKEEDGNSGSWWEGQIVSLKDKSSKFPDSPWERYVVNYPTEPTTLHFHCPWELHDPDSSFEHPQIDAPIRDKLMYNLSKYMKSASRDGDRYGILKLEEVSQEERFKNRFPVPLSLEIVKARLENNYYRSLESMNHDIAVILENASSYSDKDKGLLLKMKKLGDFFNRKFSRF